VEGKDLSGAILYTSCEPCPMCRGAALWSHVDKVVFAADRFDAADAGFDDAAFYEMLERGEGIEEYAHEDLLAPFDRWRANVERTEY
jgi:guanine deaminase